MMKEKNSLEQGWAFASHLVGSNMPTQAASAYVQKVNSSIEYLTKDLEKLKSDLSNSHLSGFVAEHWHAGTFNVNATAAGSTSTAIVPESNVYASVDISVQSSDKIINEYSSKYMATAKVTVAQQSLYNRESNQPKYHDQKRLVPSDQIDDAKIIANRRSQKELLTRPDIAKSYKETSENLTDTISDGKVESNRLSKKESNTIAGEIKEDKFSAEKHGITADNAIKPEYIIKHAAQAGVSAAVVTMIMKIAPEIFKAIDYLIKTGEIDINQVNKIGKKAISSGAQGFLRGSIACIIQINCSKGAFGVALKNIDPIFLGTVVALTMETVWNSVLVAAGRMPASQMGAALLENVLISSGYIAGAKIGGIIGQALGFKLPVIGYFLGSLIGCSFASIYNIGKKKFISFCVDTGFTCFGLVEQDYRLPEEDLKKMKIDFSPITSAEISRTETSYIQLHSGADRSSFETIDIKVFKRGIIGVNKVGNV